MTLGENYTCVCYLYPTNVHDIQLNHLDMITGQILQNVDHNIMMCQFHVPELLCLCIFNISKSLYKNSTYGESYNITYYIFEYSQNVSDC